MRILLTATAHRRFGDRLPADTEAVVMEADGTLAGGLAWEDAGVEVAWPTADLFEPGAPVRPYFAFLVQSTTLRWIQSSAAGVDAPVFARLVRRGIRLTTSHVTDIPISEYVMRSVLDHYQRPQEWAASSAERAWRRHDFRHDVARRRAREHRHGDGGTGACVRSDRDRRTPVSHRERTRRSDDPARGGHRPRG